MHSSQVTFQLFPFNEGTIYRLEDAPWCIGDTENRTKAMTLSQTEDCVQEGLSEGAG